MTTHAEALPKSSTTRLVATNATPAKVFVTVKRSDALAISAAVEADRRLGRTSPAWMKQIAAVIDTGAVAEPVPLADLKRPVARVAKPQRRPKAALGITGRLKSLLNLG